MIKAEVIEHPGVEVPNWLTKCKDVITNPSIVTTVAVLVVAVFGIVLWRDRQPTLSNTTGIQSIPSSASTLQVINSSNLPVPSAAPLSQNQTSTPVGPAPTASRDNLQPTGLVNNGAPGLTQAAQAIQNAGHASPRAMDNLNL